MPNIHYYVDTTGCLNDWGIVLAGAIEANMRSHRDVDYTLIIPKKITDQSAITYVPLALFKDLNRGRLKVHLIDTNDPVKSSHLITALITDRLRQIVIDHNVDSKQLEPKDHCFCILTTPDAHYTADILNSVAWSLGYERVSFSVDMVKSSETNK
ncbi:MAG: hypothetical protein NC489_08720 [Ruminococcus flavefaciens]|nr:hypothetical protein [Ruminococcus flavefaciens]